MASFDGGFATEHLVQQQRHEEHPLGVVQVRNREDRDPRLTGLRVQQVLDVERLALHPRPEPGCREQVVERHREAEPIA
jgi:hypothetical protein